MRSTPIRLHACRGYTNDSQSKNPAALDHDPPDLTVAGKKPPKMGGLNRVVSVGMDLLRTSKKMFLFLYNNGPYVSDFGIVGPPVGQAIRPPAGPTAGNPAYTLETKGRWY